MNCPKCHKEFFCGCTSCMWRREKKELITSRKAGNFSSCGYCGFKMCLDEWLEEEYKQYKYLNMD